MTNILLAKDLVSIFLEIYNGDISDKKNVNLEIDVNSDNLDLWGKQKEMILELVNYVTGADKIIWDINFKGLESFEIENLDTIKKVDINELDIHKLDSVSLISGGLDSYSGSHYNYINEENTIYVGYAMSDMDKSYINRVKDIIIKNTPTTEEQFFLVEKMHKNKIRYTQRSRSLLFFALAVYTAVLNNIDIVNVFENGTMSLNPSISLRDVTKTTHPKTLYLYQNILENIGLNVTIKNPFLFYTKGMVVESLTTDEFKEGIKDTRSCSFGQQKIGIEGYNSSGSCVPCILRKISIASKDLEEYDHEYVIPYDGNLEIIKKINPEKVKSLRGEYFSSLRYHKKLKDIINRGEIAIYIDIDPKYYKYLRPDLDAQGVIDLNVKMFNDFEDEISIFLRKYN